MSSIFSVRGRDLIHRRTGRGHCRPSHRRVRFRLEDLEPRTLLTATLSVNSVGVVDFLSQTTGSTVDLLFDAGTDTYTFDSTEGILPGAVDPAFTYTQNGADLATLTPVAPSTQDFTSLAFDQNVQSIAYKLSSLGTPTTFEDASLPTPAGTPMTDTFDFGSTGSAQAFTRSVAVALAKELAAITVDDSADSTPQAINMTSTQVNFNSTPAFGYSGTTVTSLQVMAGSGVANNTVNVTGTPAGAAASVVLGTGNDYVSVVGTGVATTPVPALTLNGGAGDNALVVNTTGTTVSSGTAGTITLGTGAKIAFSNFNVVQLIGTNTAPVITAGSTNTAVKNVPLANAVIATFTDADTIENANSYAATINWGDGSSSAGTVAYTGTSTVGGATVNDYSVSGTHAYLISGTEATHVILTDLGGTFTTVSGGIPITTILGPLAPITGAGATINVNGLATGIPPAAPKATAGTPLSSVRLVTFTDAPAPLATTAYAATIDWGDGSALSGGAITETGGVFTVSGTHVYPAPGTFPINVVVVGDGQQLTVSTLAMITATALTGGLSPQSDTGVSDTDGITSDITPTFVGTTAPGTTVEIFATPSGSTVLPGTQIAIGAANSAGAWTATVSTPLHDGSYTITAESVSSSGTVLNTASLGTVVIDTVGPVITAMTFDRFTDTVTVTYQDNLSGLDLASIGNGAYYHLSAQPLAPNVPVPKLLLPTAITITPVTTATKPEDIVTVVFNHGHSVRGGRYLIVIDSGTGNAGVQDIAGDALDGNFYGTFPTGDGLPGGNFAAATATFHNNIVLKPVPVQDGYVSPGASVIGPVPSKTTKKVKVVRATPSARLVTQAGTQAGAHDLAIEALTFDQKKDKRQQG